MHAVVQADSLLFNCGNAQECYAGSPWSSSSPGCSASANGSMLAKLITYDWCLTPSVAFPLLQLHLPFAVNLSPLARFLQGSHGPFDLVRLAERLDGEPHRGSEFAVLVSCLARRSPGSCPGFAALGVLHIALAGSLAGLAKRNSGAWPYHCYHL